MNILEETILNDLRKGGDDTSKSSNDASNATTSATTSVTGANTRSSDTYFYGDGISPVVVIGICVFFCK